MINIEERLKDIGFNEKEAKKFIECQNSNNFKGQCECLDKKRKMILDNVHKEEKQIINLDYLKYNLEKEKRHVK